MTELQHRQSLWTRFRSFILQSRRVLHVTKKPTREEFKVIVKITGLGMTAIGLLGFVVFIIAEFIV